VAPQITSILFGGGRNQKKEKPHRKTKETRKIIGKTKKIKKTLEKLKKALENPKTKKNRLYGEGGV
jgi:transcriptional regulator with AAA-type ATPase domain